jgi:hypothetical protein
MNRTRLLPTLLTALVLTGGALGQDKSRTVTLSLEEYNQLVEKAAHLPKLSSAPPSPFALTDAAFQLRVGDRTAEGRLELRGSVLRSGLVKAPLCSGLAITSAEAGGKPLPLLREGDTQSAILNGPAPFQVSLATVLPLTVEAGRASVTIPAPSAGSVRLTLDLPGDHTNVRLEPGLITGRRSGEGRTVLEATLVAGRPSTVWWATREAATPVAAREARFLSDIKTLVSVGEADLRLTILADVTVIQGEPNSFEFPIPVGFEITETSGSSVVGVNNRDNYTWLVLKVGSGAQRSHQFLISMERPLRESQAEAPLIGLKDTQRETGEILVEGSGTIELTATESGELRRMDVREVNPALRSLARSSLQAAFRFHRRPGDGNRLMLSWTRFPDAQALAAVAERAEATTLVTSQGRTLTEVSLTVRNYAQPFLKVGLPAGASLLSAEVAGEKVKPVEGADGSRVPLLRPGFRPSGSYVVSFVFLSPGAAFGKSGTSELTLPSMDLPTSLLRWEVFLPDRFVVKDFAGNATPESLYPGGISWGRDVFSLVAITPGVSSGFRGSESGRYPVPLKPGEIGGVVADETGAVVAGAEVTVRNEAARFRGRATTDSEGRWSIAGAPSGRVTVSAESPGFKTTQREFRFEDSRPARVDIPLSVAGVSETITIQSDDTEQIQQATRNAERQARKQQMEAQTAPSVNVSNLQRRVAGVLPVGVEVPRAGKAYRFLRPLVLDEETKVTFRYKAK